MAQDLSTKEPPVTVDQRESLHREMAWKVASNLFVSFWYAWSGLAYAFTTQRNFRIHVVVGTVAIALSIYLQLSSIEIAIMGLTIGAVLMMELINTALESVVDLTVQQTYHELAKIAEDCAAAAVLVSAIVSILVASVLLMPPLLEKVHLLEKIQLAISNRMT
ncbi:MAG: diacylglycerol kinase family protein [Cyanobacteria bacterium J06633_2]